jgi:hypothetical protein
MFTHRREKIRTDERRGCRTRAMPKETPREKELSEALARATAENKLLREKIEALIRRLFGAQSESSGAR